MITIVDYGMGNLRSVQKALEAVGASCQVSSDPSEIASAEKLVLPGVGAFRDAIAQLDRSGLVEPIQQHIRRDRPFLGICLGLQLLFEKSYEDGEYDGLGILPGRVIRFDLPAGWKVPHMGWNRIDAVRPSPLLKGLDSSPFVYFVHSYFVDPADRSIVAAQTDYGAPFTSMVWRGQLFATQFHPEKSQRVGLAILKNFHELR